MEREIATVEDWNPDPVIARRRCLVKWARESWSVPADVADDVQAVPADQADYTGEDPVDDETWA